MMLNELTCHCGNVHISIDHLPDDVGRCNCSVCRRYAALWGYFAPEQVMITCLKDRTVFYIWGDHQVEFHRCPLCGCITHYVTTPLCSSRIIAINMNMAEPDIVAAIPVREIDGASR